MIEIKPKYGVRYYAFATVIALIFLANSYALFFRGDGADLIPVEFLLLFLLLIYALSYVRKITITDHLEFFGIFSRHEIAFSEIKSISKLSVRGSDFTVLFISPMINGGYILDTIRAILEEKADQGIGDIESFRKKEKASNSAYGFSLLVALACTFTFALLDGCKDGTNRRGAFIVIFIASYAVCLFALRLASLRGKR